MDLGPPISYLVLEKGTPVLSRDGEEVGKVTHVLAAEEEDLFEGIVVSTHVGPGGHRFVDAEDVDSMHEAGVVLRLDGRQCEQLPEPSANPAAMRDDPAQGSTASDRMQERLRRAWDLISGNY